MDKVVTLAKTHIVYLKVGGEVCNRLGRGTRVCPIKRNGSWVKITWRNGKKRGWIHNLLESSNINETELHF
jgi:hypothetical protein